MPQPYRSTRVGHEGGEGARHSHRLSHAALSTLNGWLEAHRSKPYPTKSEKDAIQLATGLDSRQVNTWFANARRRKMSTWSSIVRTEQCTSISVVDKTNDDRHPVLDRTGTQKAQPAFFLSRYSTDIDDRRAFHCTFCTHSFTSKHDWTRHETSLHLRLKRYFCCPFSPVRTDTTTQLTVCSYCGAENPTSNHAEMHNHSACQYRPPEARVFLRKDSMRAHLRSVHECDLLPHMDTWLLQADYINSRCGFCGERFTSWNARNEHIAAHYKQGYQMSMWRGCRGLDSAIAAQVTAAIPPFLIHNEKLARRPCYGPARRYDPHQYRALLDSSADRDPGLKWKVLVQELQALVMHYSAQGYMISDKALQEYARHITYGPMESAASTAAENPEWLDTFKRAYCLGILPDQMKRHLVEVADDLEVYQDLGLRTPPSVKSDRATTLRIMFWNNGPVKKTDRRFSSIPVLPHMALPFETIAGSWPDAGILGDTIVIRDHIFSGSLRAQLNHTFTARLKATNESTDANEARSLLWIPP